MSWWSPIKLAGFRERLMPGLRRRLLPFWAVFQTDLAATVRSWVLRAWLVLTALLALVTLLDRSGPQATARQPGGDVVAAILHPIETTGGEARIVQELLKYYVVVWLTFIIVITGGTITTELGVVADSVLSRGIGRWQYFLAKLSARLAAVLGVFALVMVPAAVFLWLHGVPSDHGSASVVAADGLLETPFDEAVADPAPDCLTLGGIGIGLGRVAALLALVVTCGVALSATFSSTIISIAVGWVTLYGAGLAASLLDVKHLSPTRLIRELPELLSGNYTFTDQSRLIAGWLAAAAVIALASGTLFARRDI